MDKPASNQLPIKLQQCLIKLNEPETRMDGKVELMGIISTLMPAGIPDYLGVIRFPKVSGLIIQEGKKKTLFMICALIRDFCNSLNVSRNMNEDQIIEAAAMLMDECGNFRLEDYAMMFALAKRGALLKLYDRIDLEVITAILDAYWAKRHKAAIEAEEKAINAQETQLPLLRNTKNNEWDKIGGLSSVFADMKNAINP